MALCEDDARTAPHALAGSGAAEVQGQTTYAVGRGMPSVLEKARERMPEHSGAFPSSGIGSRLARRCLELGEGVLDRTEAGRLASCAIFLGDKKGDSPNSAFQRLRRR